MIGAASVAFGIFVRGPTPTMIIVNVCAHSVGTPGIEDVITPKRRRICPGGG